MSLVDPTQQLLEAAMRGSWLRQTALTNNIANAETPNYQRQEVNFESTLQGAIESGQEMPEVEFQEQAAPSETGPNGAGVSIDQESARLSENGLDYQALTDVVNTRNGIVRSAIGIL
jgi:flagellar basal-body rod protein FlgB